MNDEHINRPPYSTCNT